MQIRDQKGLVTGVFYMIFGAGAALVGSSYAFGSSAQMGPGYFPVMLGSALVLLGVIVALGAVRPVAEATTLPAIDWRSILWIASAIALFALTLHSLGLAVAIFLLVMVSSAGNVHRNWLHALICAAVMIVLSVAIFIIGLGIALPVLPSFLN